MRLGGFILNRVYKLMPLTVRQYAYVSGKLTLHDSRIERDILYKKLIGYQNSNEAKFIVPSESDYGSFSGKFHDVGLSWEQSLILEKIAFSEDIYD